MSKALKKLIDINRLREFKNKLVGVGSAYVQTTAVDQTIAGTKTFSKPIVGSVTGSSGSCTGNAATATKATQDSDGNKIATTYSKVGHTHDDRYYTETEVNNLLKGKANTSGTYDSFNAGNGVDSSGNGWIRFKNGIQICTGWSPSIDLHSGEIKITSITFPKSFKTAPNVITCSTNPHIIASTWSILTTGCDIYLKSTSSGDGSNFGRYIAFGTWK